MFRNWLRNRCQTRCVKSLGRPVRLHVEALEDRTLPSSYTAANVSDLIADINAANLAGGSNTIALVAGTTFALTAVNNTTDGATGVPQIAANDNLTILGNGATIARGTAGGTPAFRLFDVASGASLSLQSLTLEGGLASSAAAAALGGAIYNQGALTLSGATVKGNVAQGADAAWLGNNGQPAEGGAIYSSGALTLDGNTMIQNNQALGGQGGPGGSRTAPGLGGDARGGGVYVGGGSATLSSVTLSGNIAKGGVGGDPGSRGGSALGGGLYLATGTATLSGSSLSGNTAQGGAGGAGAAAVPGGPWTFPSPAGPGGPGGDGLGGGLYAAGGSITLANDSVTNNTAQGGNGGSGGAGHPKGANGSPGLGEGGGLYIDTAAVAYLDLYTQSNVKKNHASTSYTDIDGPYSTYP
jgi:hypothetical protein